MRTIIISLLLILLDSCSKSPVTIESSAVTCYSECDFLISADEPDEYNTYTCQGVDITERLHLSYLLGAVDHIEICFPPSTQLRALIAIDRYNGESSCSFDVWNDVSIIDNCLTLFLSPSQLKEVAQDGIVLDMIIEENHEAVSSELAHLSYDDMQAHVIEYRKQLCD